LLVKKEISPLKDTQGVPNQIIHIYGAKGPQKGLLQDQELPLLNKLEK